MKTLFVTFLSIDVFIENINFVKNFVNIVHFFCHIFREENKSAHVFDRFDFPISKVVFNPINIYI